MQGWREREKEQNDEHFRLRLLEIDALEKKEFVVESVIDRLYYTRNFIYT